MKKNLSENIYAIIPAAGLGTRFDSKIQKQYQKIGSETIIERTVNAFLGVKSISQIIIPVNALDNNIFKQKIIKEQKIKIIEGGDTRAQSVLNSLLTINDNSMVIVHDAVRPNINKFDLEKIISEFNNRDDDILVFGVPVYESLKMINKETLSVRKSVDRNDYYIAQTPQVTSSEILIKALEQCNEENFIPCDESEAIERIGGKVSFVPGSRKNTKITVIDDLAGVDDTRVGLGFDSHRYRDGDGLMIGGFKVPFKNTFEAHSDGDIVIHALVDSILGAMSLGDIGVHFPETEEWKDCSGEKIFHTAYKMVINLGYSISQVDITVIAQEPKLSVFRDDIISSVSNITKLEKANIGFKAKTSEKMGFIGNNEGAAAMVLTKLVNENSSYK